MAEEALTQPVVTQGNDQTARTATGEIKDQQATQPQGIPDATKPGETKPEAKPETKPAEGEKKPETKAEAGKVPEKYDLKAPEGYEIDAKVIEEATPIFKELNLTNDQAQKLTDLWNKHSIEAAEKVNSHYEALRTEWRDANIKSDLGNGKDDLKPEVKANVSRAIDAAGDAKAVASIKDAMNYTGVGDNPAFVAWANAIGKLLAEGTPVRGAGPAATGQAAPGTAKPSPAAAMYPNLASSSKP